jgi:hypothetical protein
MVYRRYASVSLIIDSARFNLEEKSGADAARQS